jgi:hypothetical protein
MEYSVKGICFFDEIIFRIIIAMVKNYLKTAWRNLIKNKIFSIISHAAKPSGMVASRIVSGCFYLKVCTLVGLSAK